MSYYNSPPKLTPEEQYKNMTHRHVDNLFNRSDFFKHCCGMKESPLEGIFIDVFENKIKPLDFAVELIKQYNDRYTEDKFAGFMFTGVAGQRKYINYVESIGVVVVEVGISKKTGSKIFVIILGFDRVKEFIKTKIIF